MLRLVRFFPGLRIILTAIGRGLPGVAGFLLRPGYDADGDGVPDQIDRIVVAQRLDDLRAAIASLERELRGDPDER